MRCEDNKGSIIELQELLNNVVSSDNLLTDDILDISTKLDRLIVEYYLQKNQENNKRGAKKHII